MRYLLKLALRNILRSKIRTILTFLILSFGVGLYILLACLMAGFDAATSQNVIDFETGHYKLRSQTFDEDTPYEQENFLSPAPAIVDKVSKLDFVTGVAPRVQFLAELDNGLDTTPIVAVGIGPTDNQVFTLENFIPQGRLEPGGILVGQSLAADMGVGLGDLVYLTFRDAPGMFTSIEMMITGLVNSLNPQVNKTMAFINLDEAQSYLRTDKISEIAIKTDDFTKVAEYAPQLQAVVPETEVYSWQRLTADWNAMMTMKRKFQNILLLMIMVIGIVGIVNTMLMSVYEKKREIGTMKALGFTDREVSTLFLVEGSLIGVMGGLLGLVLGTLFNSYFYFVGYDMSSFSGEQGTDFGMPVMGVVKSVWLVSAYVYSMIFAFMAATLASYYPAKKVTKMEAMECLRTVQ